MQFSPKPHFFYQTPIHDPSQFIFFKRFPSPLLITPPPSTFTVRKVNILHNQIIYSSSSAEKMHRAMQHYKGLKEAIWRVCSIRLSVPLINNDPMYKVYSKDSVRVMCQRSEIASLNDHGVFRPTDQIREAVLIEGSLNCTISRQMFTGPILLPKSVQAFQYDIENKPIILLILNKGGTGYEPKEKAPIRSPDIEETNTTRKRNMGSQVKEDAIIAEDTV